MRLRSQLPQLQVAAATTARLRAAGYPAPTYRCVGLAGDRAYSVQTALPGAPAQPLTQPLVGQLVALNALQAGRALPGPSPWPAPLVAPMLHGGPGFCLLDPMREHSLASAALLARTQTIARAAAGQPLPQSDIVHFDWTMANILVADGRVAGVIDWEGTCAGDRAFDLAKLRQLRYRCGALGGPGGPRCAADNPALSGPCGPPPGRLVDPFP